jgi:hypothetical protein
MKSERQNLILGEVMTLESNIFFYFKKIYVFTQENISIMQTLQSQHTNQWLRKWKFGWKYFTSIQEVTDFLILHVVQMGGKTCTSFLNCCLILLLIRHVIGLDKLSDKFCVALLITAVTTSWISE